MKSKISFFKGGFILSDLKRFWWISALYAIALLFLLPLNHFMQRSNKIYLINPELLKERIMKDLCFVNSPNQLLLLVFPVIIGVVVFRYIQKGRSASFYHSLPVTRASLFLNSILSCSILFITPLFVTVSAMFMLNSFSFLSGYYSAHLLINWFFNSLLFGILFLAMTVFVGMFTGNSIAQLVFVYILNVLPVFFSEFIRIHLCQLLYGFDNFSELTFYNFMPMVMLFNSSYNKYTAATKIFFIILTVLLFIGALAVFKFRKPETAGDIITFKPLNPVFIYGVTFCGTLLGGAYFGVIQGTFISFPFQVFGYFASALLSYAVVQMISNKTFRILHTWKGYAGYAAVLCALLLFIRLDVTGYVNYVPEASEVEDAYLGNNINYWLERDKPYFNIKNYYSSDTAVYKDTKNLENLTKLQKLILENRSTEGYSNYLAYKLKNGKTIIRKYTLDTDLYASALGPIYESQEYMGSRFPILQQEAADLKYIEIADNRIRRNPVVVSGKTQLDSFKDAVRKDISHLEYNELVNLPQRVLYIDIIDNEDRAFSYEIRSSFTNTMDWLKKEGLFEKVVIKPEDVAFVILTNVRHETYYGSDKTSAENTKNIKITDKNLIRELLNFSFDIDVNKHADYVAVFSKNGDENPYNISLSFNKKVSASLQKYIDQLK